MTPVTDAQLLDRAFRANRAASAAQRKARKVAADETVNRSTRMRNALKIKADALDDVAKVLTGKA